MMKKQFLNLGKALNKAEQKVINGGIKEPQVSCKCTGLTPTIMAPTSDCGECNSWCTSNLYPTWMCVG